MQSKLKKISKCWVLYVLFIPVFVYYFIFNYIPMYGTVLAFKDYRIAKGILGSPWIGLKKYRELFSLYYFWEVFKNTIIISFGRIIFEFPMPIILAIMLSELRQERYKKVLQTVFTFPHFLSWVIVAGIVKNFLRIDGFVNNVLQVFNIDPIPFLSLPNSSRLLLYATSIWKNAGWSSIIYLAAITTIDESLYEAAIIDGANRIQRILYITLPSIAFTIGFMLTLTISNIMNAGFDQIFNMMNPITKEKLDIIDTYIYEITFKRNPDYSFSTAVGLFKSVINVFMLIIANKVVKKLGGKGIYSID